MEPHSASVTNPPSLHVEDSTAPEVIEQPSPLRKIVVVASIAAGIQFGWALQLTLLTPYVQILGTPHMWVSFIWLCGPISGIVVQPVVGYHSDRCTSRFGRRRPFIAAGTVAVTVAGILIAFGADLGHMFGDRIDAKIRPRTIAVSVVGFWIIDFANNMLQGPCRALLADLAAGDNRKTRTAYAFFSFFMAVGNVTGSAAASAGHLHRILPFTQTKACNENCANIKTCFLISITLLLTLTIAVITYVKEKRLTASLQKNETRSKSGFGQLFGAFRELKRPMWILLLVTCFNWIAWFPFFEYNTDWMGREVFGGKDDKGKLYLMGVHAGSLGMMLNSAVAGTTSLGVEYLARGVGGVKRLWGIVNFLLAVCLGMTVLVSKLAQHSRRYTVGVGGVQEPLPPPPGIKAGALTLFSVLGIPLAITYSVPFALASIFSSDAGAGQGLSLGVLNLAITIPQMLMSAISGPWDKLFGGSNLPSFVVGAVAAAISGVLSMILLPSPPPDLAKAATAVAGGFH